MLKDFKFHHVGYVTDSIDNTSAMFLKLGYECGEKVLDPIQNVYICFLHKNDAPGIELVEPFNESSSLNKLLKKSGVSPYHICYEVPNIEKAYDELLEEEFIPLFRPVEATAMDNRQICYMYKKEIGYIELVNE
ncbi:VOC family protein [uncultured Bacteroides sp.]|uniref:VOC family protein n=1 Tax=uncultured Bacteroides sp. TaxID=162156 RepID=UPI002AA75FC0|nr:VOC family protein [uncultured Bacteroides sp.]